MQGVAAYFGESAGAITFNVSLMVVCYLIARVANARPISALVFGFLLLLIGFALGGGTGHELMAAIT
jgi:hypothetical protein